MNKRAMTTRSLTVILSACLCLFAQAVQSASDQSIRTVQEQYVAFYGRPGDMAGILYWADALEQQGGLAAIQAAFADSEEFRTRIIPGEATSVDALDTDQIKTLINNLYQNMFARDGDPEGIDFWSTELTSGRRTLVDISTAIADGAQNGGSDRTILDNRVTLAQRISEAIDSNGLTYSDAQISTARDFLFSAIDDSNDDPQAVTLDSLLSSLDSTGNSAPVAQAGADQTVTIGQSVLLDGSASTDADGVITRYQWKQLLASAKAHKQPRIINGSYASAGQFPWQVAILSDPNDGYQSQTCGGSIIHEKWILTAAHCYDPNTPDTYIAAGVLDLNNLNPDYVIKAARWIVHPQYDSESVDNDIALIELETPLDLAGCGSACSKITLVTPDNESSVMPVSAPVFVSGWGNTSTSGEVFDPLLQWVELQVMDCTSPPSQFTSVDITDNMFCAGVPTFDKDSCQGDSGGPLAVNTSSGYLLSGIVSWGTECAAEGFPGVFTRVANYSQWISDNTGGDCCTSSTGDNDGETPVVTLTNADTAQATFIAPSVTTSTTLTFELTVTDDKNASASDQINIIVSP